MSLGILSVSPVKQNITYMQVALAALNAKLNFYVTDFAIGRLGAIEVCINKKYERDREDEEYFLMDVMPEAELNLGGIPDGCGNEAFYLLAGTNNDDYPHLMYDFSLVYLRQNPYHLISVYNEKYSLEYFEKVEKSTGYNDNWMTR